MTVGNIVKGTGRQQVNDILLTMPKIVEVRTIKQPQKKELSSMSIEEFIFNSII